MNLLRFRLAPAAYSMALLFTLSAPAQDGGKVDLSIQVRDGKVADRWPVVARQTEQSTLHPGLDKGLVQPGGQDMGGAGNGAHLLSSLNCQP